MKVLIAFFGFLLCALQIAVLKGFLCSVVRSLRVTPASTCPKAGKGKK